MSPTDDRDIRAALSRDPYPSGATRLSTDAEGAVVPMLDGQPDPLREAALLALKILISADHCSIPDERAAAFNERCDACSDPWPCETEQARRVLADALEDR